MKGTGLLLVLLIIASVAGGCISQSQGTQSGRVSPPIANSQQSSPTTASVTSSHSLGNLPLPSRNYTPIYTGYGKGCPTGRVPVTFTYIGNESVKSVSLRGSFNNWGEWPMEYSNGTWSITVCLRPGKYEYKYFINGQWIKDMSTGNDGKPVDPEADAYAPDGYGGKNAVRIVRGGASFYVNFEPNDPAYLSVADNRTVVRFRAEKGSVVSALW
jgi:cyclomaltodextrinase